ncbi:hypothetical protein Q4524_16510 [Alteromonas stellipolaris]|uniref:hypothetical protein n=1 Tax=Alteromonas stellipolaris TaxID=233316 RepID=UPI0026E1AC15|nr:hypothetical protein [Alteromonas stellipolaris]MDO6540188.1 hypothetical protein [Alteromonas stellipolaris]
MDAVAKAPWMGLRCVFYSTNKQSGLLKEAVVEAHVKSSAAWTLWQRPHGRVHAVLLMGCYFHGGVDFKRKGFVRLGNSLQHGCCSEGPMGSLRRYLYPTNNSLLC